MYEPYREDDVETEIRFTINCHIILQILLFGNETETDLGSGQHEFID